MHYSRNEAPLALLRQRRGLNQNEVAQRLKVSNEYLCRVERGSVSVSERLADRLGHIYKVTAERIIRLNHEARRVSLEASLRRSR